jgi:hypothetical protein
MKHAFVCGRWLGGANYTPRALADVTKTFVKVPLANIQGALPECREAPLACCCR